MLKGHLKMCCSCFKANGQCSVIVQPSIPTVMHLFHFILKSFVESKLGVEGTEKQADFVKVQIDIKIDFHCSRKHCSIWEAH